MIKGRGKIMLISLIVLGVLVFAFCGFLLITNYRLGKIPAMTFQDTLEYVTKKDSKTIITVGIIKNGEVSYKVYGENAKELPAELYVYEIGSLTKTFTAALINKAVKEGKINIDDSIAKYLSLPSNKKYPTIKELLTHTSGYKSHYFERSMIKNFFKGRNDFYGVSKDSVLKKVCKISLKQDDYKFNYSNFGFAVLGLVIENVYNCDYVTLLNDFAQKELGLSSTKISDKSGNLGNYWDWDKNDAHLPAGAITSNIEDMLLYAKMQLEEKSLFDDCHKSLKKVDGSNKMSKSIGINIDEIGMSWIIDTENNLVWHNGGTGHYNSYLGFNKKTGNGVVVLANYPPSMSKIPATVIGIKLLKELDEAGK